MNATATTKLGSQLSTLLELQKSPRRDRQASLTCRMTPGSRYMNTWLQGSRLALLDPHSRIGEESTDISRAPEHWDEWTNTQQSRLQKLKSTAWYECKTNRNRKRDRNRKAKPIWTHCQNTQTESAQLLIPQPPECNYLNLAKVVNSTHNWHAVKTARDRLLASTIKCHQPKGV